LLKQDIAVYQDSVIEFKAIITSKNEHILMLDDKLDTTRWYLMIVIGAVIGTIVWRVYKKIKPI
jgi:hypothetical protein